VESCGRIAHHGLAEASHLGWGTAGAGVGASRESRREELGPGSVAGRIGATVLAVCNSTTTG
jgi:hypothetical protein